MRRIGPGDVVARVKRHRLGILVQGTSQITGLKQGIAKLLQRLSIVDFLARGSLLEFDCPALVEHGLPVPCFLFLPILLIEFGLPLVDIFFQLIPLLVLLRHLPADCQRTVANQA